MIDIIDILFELTPLDLAEQTWRDDTSSWEVISDRSTDQLKGSKERSQR
jgi:hypothetical protein